MDKDNPDRRLLIAALEQRLREGKVTQDHFEKRVEQEGLYEALSWVNITIAAATIQICGELLEALTAEDSKATPESIREHVYRKLVSGARWPKCSFNPLSNLLHRDEICVYSDVLRDLDRILRGNT
jgi:hypothetical protein